MVHCNFNMVHCKCQHFHSLSTTLLRWGVYLQRLIFLLSLIPCIAPPATTAAAPALALSETSIPGRTAPTNNGSTWYTQVERVLRKTRKFGQNRTGRFTAPLPGCTSKTRAPWAGLGAGFRAGALAEPDPVENISKCRDLSFQLHDLGIPCCNLLLRFLFCMSRFEASPCLQTDCKRHLDCPEGLCEFELTELHLLAWRLFKPKSPVRSSFSRVNSRLSSMAFPWKGLSFLSPRPTFKNEVNVRQKETILKLLRYSPIMTNQQTNTLSSY